MKNYTLHPDVTIGPGPKGKGKKVTFYGPDDKVFDKELWRDIGCILLTMLTMAVFIVAFIFSVLYANDIDRGTELAFSGEDKAWRSKNKNKCLF